MAKILFCSDRPSILGQPFADSEIQLLQKYTSTAGLGSIEYVVASDQLASIIQAHAPNVVVAFGDKSLFDLTGLLGIAKYRGSVLASTLTDTKVIPMLHPRDILAAWNWQEIYIGAEIMVRKVVPQSRTKELVYLPWKELLSPSVHQACQLMNTIHTPFSLDIETRGDGIACVGLAWSEGNSEVSMCIPLQTTKGSYFDTATEEYDFWRSLNDLCQRETVIGHNLFYDLDWLRVYGIVPRNIHDTMLMFHRLYPELPKALEFVTMWLTDMPYYKSEGTTWGRNNADEQLWKYNIKDCIATLRAYTAMDALKSDVKFAKALKLYENHTLEVLPAAFEMQILGMDVDSFGWEYAKTVLEVELAKIRIRLAELSDGQLITREGNKKITDKQVATYLYDVLKLAPKYNRKTKTLTADEDALVELLIQWPKLEVLKAIIAERKFGKALNSYININWCQD